MTIHWYMHGQGRDKEFTTGMNLSAGMFIPFGCQRNDDLKGWIDDEIAQTQREDSLKDYKRRLCLVYGKTVEADWTHDE